MQLPIPPPEPGTHVSPLDIASGLGILLAGAYSGWRWLITNRTREMHRANTDRLDLLAEQVNDMREALETISNQVSRTSYQVEGHIQQMLAIEEGMTKRLDRLDTRFDETIKRLDLRIDGAVMIIPPPNRRR